MAEKMGRVVHPVQRSACSEDSEGCPFPSNVSVHDWCTCSGRRAKNIELRSKELIWIVNGTLGGMRRHSFHYCAFTGGLRVGAAPPAHLKTTLRRVMLGFFAEPQPAGSRRATQEGKQVGGRWTVCCTTSHREATSASRDLVTPPELK